MATRKTIEKIMRNWQAYYLAYDSKIEIQKNGVKVDDFTLNQDSDKVINILVPTNADYVDLTSAQSIWWVKTFTSAPVVPSKTTDATNTWTAVATESQVYKKQDKLTLPATPTSWNLVVWWANNKTLADWWAIPTYSAWDNITIENWVISATNTIYPELSKSDLDTWTWTTASVVSAKAIADYVSWKIWSAVNYRWQVNSYADLPASPTKWDMYNVVQAHTTTPKFDAWTNVVWNWTSWDAMAEMVDLSNLVDLTSAQTISWAKTFSTAPILPSASSLPATPSNTKPATEWQVKSVKDLIPTVNNSIISFTQAWEEVSSTFSTNQASAWTIALMWNSLKTATEYSSLPSSKNTDWNWYFIVNEIETA